MVTGKSFYVKSSRLFTGVADEDGLVLIFILDAEADAGGVVTGVAGSAGAAVVVASAGTAMSAGVAATGGELLEFVVSLVKGLLEVGDLSVGVIKLLLKGGRVSGLPSEISDDHVQLGDLVLVFIKLAGDVLILFSPLSSLSLTGGESGLEVFNDTFKSLDSDSEVSGGSVSFQISELLFKLSVGLLDLGELNLEVAVGVEEGVIFVLPVNVVTVVSSSFGIRAAGSVGSSVATASTRASHARVPTVSIFPRSVTVTTLRTADGSGKA